MESAKMLILNNRNNQDFKAVLNLKASSPSLIKFYNLTSTRKNLALGIKQSTSVVKVPLKLSDNNCQFSLPKEINLKENLFCAIVDVTNAFCPEIVLSGSANGQTENNLIESAFVQTKPQDTSILYEQDQDAQINALIDKNLQDDMNTTYYDNCAECKYKKAFYEGGNCYCHSEPTATQIQNQNLVHLNSNSTHSIEQNLTTSASFKEQNNINNDKNHFEQNKIQNANTCQTEKNSTPARSYEQNSTSFISSDAQNTISPSYQSEQNNTMPASSYEQNATSPFYHLEQNSNNSVCSHEQNTTLESHLQALGEESQNNIPTDESQSPNFYFQIKSQIDSLFAKYKSEEILQQIIPNSKWVKVEYDEGQYYVMGLIYDDAFKNVEYISYGMPSTDSTTPPDDLKTYAQWLEVESIEPNKGYWLVYQDANNGETIKVDFV